MEHERFDRLIRNLAHGLTRRGVIAGLTALAGVTLAASDDGEAKKKKKVTLCRNGQTITVTKKKKQKHLQPGDITGPCPPPVPPGPPVGPPGPPPSPPPGPPPPPSPLDCPPPVPNHCAKLNTCESPCSTGKVFDADSCVCVCDQPTTCCFCTRGDELLDFGAGVRLRRPARQPAPRLAERTRPSREAMAVARSSTTMISRTHSARSPAKRTP